MKKNRKFIYLLSVLLLSIIYLSQCVYLSPASQDARGAQYAGMETCKSCHQAVYDSVLQSGHYNASAPATPETVLGQFEMGKNSFDFEGDMKVVMEKRADGYYQVLYAAGKEKFKRRYDITMGVKNGQTCLTWEGKNMYQLPISYYTSVANWGTSPGFTKLFPEFNRLVGKNCFECHSSFVKGVEPVGPKTGDQLKDMLAAEAMLPSSVITGIDCERCHGPAAKHVQFQQENPTVKTAQYIVSGKQLNYQQLRDKCALCHAGNDQEKLKSRFLFQPGDSLIHYFKPGTAGTNFDVHGNQYGLLSQSKCFINNASLNCNTCHSPHGNAVKSVAVYSQKCMNCHSEAMHNYCKATAPAGMNLQENCVSCHMPEQPSAIINFQLNKDNRYISQQFRTHKIGIYKTQGKE